MSRTEQDLAELMGMYRDPSEPLYGSRVLRIVFKIGGRENLSEQVGLAVLGDMVTRFLCNIAQLSAWTGDELQAISWSLKACGMHPQSSVDNLPDSRFLVRDGWRVFNIPWDFSALVSRLKTPNPRAFVAYSNAGQVPPERAQAVLEAWNSSNGMPFVARLTSVLSAIGSCRHSGEWFGAYWVYSPTVFYLETTLFAERLSIGRDRLLTNLRAVGISANAPFDDPEGIRTPYNRTRLWVIPSTTPPPAAAPDAHRLPPRTRIRPFADLPVPEITPRRDPETTLRRNPPRSSGRPNLEPPWTDRPPRPRRPPNPPPDIQRHLVRMSTDIALRDFRALQPTSSTELRFDPDRLVYPGSPALLDDLEPSHLTMEREELQLHELGSLHSTAVNSPRSPGEQTSESESDK